MRTEGREKREGEERWKIIEVFNASGFQGAFTYIENVTVHFTHVAACAVAAQRGVRAMRLRERQSGRASVIDTTGKIWERDGE